MNRIQRIWTFDSGGSVTLHDNYDVEAGHEVRERNIETAIRCAKATGWTIDLPSSPAPDAFGLPPHPDALIDGETAEFKHAFRSKSIESFTKKAIEDARKHVRDKPGTRKARILVLTVAADFTSPTHTWHALRKHLIGLLNLGRDLYLNVIALEYGTEWLYVDTSVLCASYEPMWYKPRSPGQGPGLA